MPEEVKLPEAPPEYDQSRVQQLIRELEVALSRVTQANDIYAGGLPTSAVDLRPGQLYVDNGTIRVVQ